MAVDASTPAGCGRQHRPWCRCRGLPTAGWSWPSTSPAGCARRSHVTGTDPVSHPRPGLGAAHPRPRLALLDHLRTGIRPQLMDRTPGRASSGARRRHRHGHRPTTARSASATDHHGAVNRRATRTSSSSRTPDTTHPASASSRRTCPCRCRPGCDRTESYTGLSHPGCRTPRAGRPGTEASPSSDRPAPGAPRTPKPSPTPVSTAPPPPAPGTGFIPN